MLGQLPPDTGKVIGREAETRRALESLRPVSAPADPEPEPGPGERAGARGETRAAADLVVTGPPGAGRTAFACHVARTAYNKGWFGGILYVDLHDGGTHLPDGTKPGNRTARDSDSGGGSGDRAAHYALGALLRSLGAGPERVPARRAERAALYRDMLAHRARTGSRPLLVVVDGASDAGQVLPLVPPDGAARMLVAGRGPLPGVEGPCRLDLGPLPLEDAATLMTEIVTCADPSDPRTLTDPGALREAAELCGRLPLALAVAATALVDRPRTTVRKLADELGKAAARQRTRPAADAAADPGASGPGPSGPGASGPGASGPGPSEPGPRHPDPPGLRAAFDLAHRRLADDDRRLLRLLSLHPGPHLGVDAVATLADLDRADARKRLETLRRARLLRVCAPYEGYRLPDPVRRYAADRAGTDGSAAELATARGRLLAHWAATVHEADRRLRGHRDLDEARTGVPRGVFPALGEAVRWLDAERPALVAAVRYAHGAGEHRHALDLARGLTAFLDLRGHRDDWEAVHLTAAEAARASDDRPALAGLLEALGRCRMQQGLLAEAAGCWAGAERAHRETGDERGRQRARGLILSALQEDDRTGEGESAAGDRERTGDGPGPGNRGAAAGGVPLLTAALEAYDLPGDGPVRAALLDRLGALRLRRQEHDAALRCHREALRLREGAEAAEGADAVGDAGRSLLGLGNVHRARGAADEALRAYGRAAECFREAGDREGEARARYNSGLLHIDVPGVRALRGLRLTRQDWRSAAGLLRREDVRQARRVEEDLAALGGLSGRWTALRGHPFRPLPPPAPLPVAAPSLPRARGGDAPPGAAAGPPPGGPRAVRSPERLDSEPFGPEHLSRGRSEPELPEDAHALAHALDPAASYHGEGSSVEPEEYRGPTVGHW
ncbi:hypothetical protein GQS52_04140 [Streptomyces sp. SCUT-3]|uniref:tetratricopeptide repeat protein n=1 Tax=Streptomyces sp. SCUT-3 TaxID=2684469 RepID=UPI0015FAAD64|nr:tetratricopeptide repeat protein [Streptomyces sp. SCUT-3]QMV21096.1 hypothetical protein GQS52_04140 [Streptomyces sp. SCUT-3]